MVDLENDARLRKPSGADAPVWMLMGLLLALSLAQDVRAMQNSELELPYLIPGHGYENACPKTAAVLPESRGRTIHAAPSASGLGDGSTKDDAVSLDEAITVAMPGDTIVLSSGQYGEMTWPAGTSGTEGNPITLRADYAAAKLSGQAPDLRPEPTDPSRYSRLSLTIDHARFIRIEGIYGPIETYGASFIELKNNYHYSNEDRNIQLDSSTNIVVHGSLFENFRLRDGRDDAWWTDYGAANYYQRRTAYYNNYFNGGFNHAISLKTSNSDVTISCNRFSNCGRHCVELGQQTDGTLPESAPTDRTSQRVLIKNNLFEFTDEQYVNADFAVMVMNVDDVLVEDNRFSGSFAHSILISSYWAPSYCATKGEVMSQVGIKPDFARVAGNHFDGATNIRITGRGVSNDTVEIGGVTGGPVTCEVRGVTPITCDEICCRWDKSLRSELPPHIVQLDDTISCR